MGNVDRSEAMVKNALEPEWEARFEGASYGFRPGRCTHDAIAQIFQAAKGKTTRRWILDADIQGAFDNISHDYILNTIGQVPGRELIRQWLKAGYVEMGALYPTEAGTPQGGVISPVLANIALHGMEAALESRFHVRRNRNRRTGSRVLVRYADDFVALCPTQEDAIKARELLTVWLAERGLTFSEGKTHIVHLTEGFNFLGWNIRHYQVTDRTSGYKLLIKPSKESVKAIRAKLRDIWMAHRGKPVDVVIRKLNPVIRGWATYHRGVVASGVFKQLDHWMYQRAKSHVRFLHPRQPVAWRRRRYWGNRNPDRPDANWVFGLAGDHPFLLQFAWTHITRHIAVKGTSSLDDPGLRGYWEQRRRAKAKHEPSRQWRTIILRQNGLCPRCGESIVDSLAEGTVTMIEERQRHHQQPRQQGGSNAWENLVILHLYCHQQAHAGLRRQNVPT